MPVGRLKDLFCARSLSNINLIYFIALQVLLELHHRLFYLCTGWETWICVAGSAKQEL